MARNKKDKNKGKNPDSIRRRAYAWAEERLKDLKRGAKDDNSFLHSLRVARPFENFSGKIYAAAILHDVPEDLGKTAKEVESILDSVQKEFGTEVRFYVEQLTNWHPDSATRNFVVGSLVSKCSRLTIGPNVIKLSDRLDNLNSMGSVWDSDRQKRYAIEALALLQVIPRTPREYTKLAGLEDELRARIQIRCFEVLDKKAG